MARNLGSCGSRWRMSLGRVVAYARWEVSKASGMRGARWMIQHGVVVVMDIDSPSRGKEPKVMESGGEDSIQVES
ncbi:hypothetical protein GOBAR_AA30109 [Gossypium barbadense]|uniref:Uncharacterized protein n=1 Tax=Gossypium barbadense TaxID=3634 RepID=A0A2P5WHM8_GOSBA|nr:hypothetical protein GOBAR_AA30109 [Gossypium barbadense]